MKNDHYCYDPANRNKLDMLRALEKKQRSGKLTKNGYYELLKLKDNLKIGK